MVFNKVFYVDQKLKGQPTKHKKIQDGEMSKYLQKPQTKNYLILDGH